VARQISSKKVCVRDGMKLDGPDMWSGYKCPECGEDYKNTRLGYMPWDVWMAYNRLRHYSLKEFYSDLLTDPLNKDTHFYKKAVKYLRELGLMEEAEVGG
jgi:hypothetical protein